MTEKGVLTVFTAACIVAFLVVMFLGFKPGHRSEGIPGLQHSIQCDQQGLSWAECQ